ncbi:pimeloyl-ACP methyl ester esterase BioH [Atlantibacter hermannii]|uniref:pimeloyl-ACP methyl ester esterase BioH n=1 Tax=Atlantibacter hermannii TaxID=565 RepID=UPI0028AD257C|nr:pimeloyl-ACP methyl ester esterase BioH [Atlantibacter hermannii]MCQ4967368.1 pimeloyl-ACP methyl ester esterase BioH [Enterobacteriaceae bacterium DFI.7.85]
MNDIWWQTRGEGNVHLVLLHGWGLNAGVWDCITQQLASQFTLHLVDLPGYGRSGGFGAMDLDAMAQCVLRQAPDRAIWLGWSLGGLVASQIALTHPERVEALVTVASSPCFSAREEEQWPGIKPAVLAGFQRQLSEDFQRTVERFLALQTLGTESARQDARRLKTIVLDAPMPSVDVLNGGLEILRTADLRAGLDGLRLPFWRLYGRLDGLVPRRVAGLLDTRYPQSTSLMFDKSAHAPFISHPDEFCESLQRIRHCLENNQNPSDT